MNSDAPRTKAVLVGVQVSSVSEAEHRANLDELARLCSTLGLEVIGRVTQRRSRPRAGTVVGAGKLEELARWTGGSGNPGFTVPRKNKLKERRAEEEAADETFEDEIEESDEEEASLGNVDVHAEVVVVDHELTPSEQRNLERATGAEVLDRSQVIVEIFHRHAKTREARLQVEIARLTYVAPRLREAGAGADRQRGGIGGKGAGESAVELDKRRIRDRIAELRRELQAIEHEQKTRRALRKDARRVALVGYTNAGKSSLMRALSGSEVLVEDKLFATLDTTVRALKPETEPRILVSDTVGFIKKLPHELVASFRSTLDEALEASLLLYVVDASASSWRAELEVTQTVLGEIGAGHIASLILLNKRDRIDDATANILQTEFPNGMLLSAHDPSDIAKLHERIVEFFDGALVEREVTIPYDRYAIAANLHETMTVLGERHDETGVILRLRAPTSAFERIEERLRAGAS